MPNSIRERSLSVPLVTRKRRIYIYIYIYIHIRVHAYMYIDLCDGPGVYDFPSRILCRWPGGTEGAEREGWTRKRTRTWTRERRRGRGNPRPAGRRETSKSRGPPRSSLCDWLWNPGTGYALRWGDANARASERASERPRRGFPGSVDGCRKGRGGRGWFFSNQATC